MSNLTAFEIVEREVTKQLREKDARINELERKLKEANHQTEMYANAWQRELVQYDGKIYNKRWHIDAMVKTTSEFIKDYRQQTARLIELESQVQNWNRNGQPL